MTNASPKLPTVSFIGPTTNLSDQRYWNALLAFGLVLAGCVGNFLIFNQYPLLVPETGLFLLLLSASASLLMLPYIWNRPIPRAFAEAFIILWAIDLNFQYAIAAIVAATATFAFVLLSRRSILPGVTFFAGILFISSIVGLGGSRDFLTEEHAAIDLSERNAELPAIVHIILDEHIGIDGITGPEDNGDEVRSTIRNFYVDNGFALYSRSYSEYLHTVNSVPQILNFGEEPNTESSESHVSINESAYLTELRNQGYQIDIFQSEYANICAADIYDSCTNYWSQSLPLLRRQEFEYSDRAYFLTMRFLGQSDIAKGSTKIFSRLAVEIGQPDLRVDLDSRGKSASLGSLMAFDELIGRLREIEPGQAVIAHMLFPHYPYVAEADCSVRSPLAWDVRRSATPMEHRQSLYLRQILCATSKIEEAIAAVRQSSAGNNYIFIVHGDHGSRLTIRDPNMSNLETFSDEDMIAGFSTLFAVRGNAIEPGYVDAPAPVAELLRQLALSGFRSRPDAIGGGLVFLEDSDWIPQDRHALPAEWMLPGAE